jgi:hypothetical protein
MNPYAAEFVPAAKLKKGVKFPNNPVSTISNLPMNANSVESRKGLTRAQKEASLVEARSGVNNPRPIVIRNLQGSAELTSFLRGLTAQQQALQVMQELQSQELARLAMAAYAAEQAAKPKELIVRTNNCKQQGGTRKIKRKSKAHRSHSYKHVKGHRSR